MHQLVGATGCCRAIADLSLVYSVIDLTSIAGRRASYPLLNLEWSRRDDGPLSRGVVSDEGAVLVLRVGACTGWCGSPRLILPCPTCA